MLKFSFAVILTCLIITVQNSYGQYFSPYFSTITTEQGLANNQVNCILQDKRGFLWFGTEDGLNRYDGQNFTKFMSIPGNKASLSGNMITALTEDQDAVLWITTENGGLTKYDYRLKADQQFKRFTYNIPAGEHTSENSVVKLLDDQHGYLWLIIKSNSLIRFCKKTEKFDAPVDIGHKELSSFTIDNSGTLWVGRVDGRLLKINTSTFTYELANPESYYKNGSIRALYKDAAQNIWYSTADKKIYQINHQTSKEVLFSGDSLHEPYINDEIISFCEDSGHNLWMGGVNSGIFFLNKKTNQISNFNHSPFFGSLIDNQVNCIYECRTGIIWIGTPNGFNVFNPLYKPFVRNDLPLQGKDIIIYDFLKDEPNRLLIGTNHGLYIKHLKENKFENRPLTYQGHHICVTKFFKDIDGTLYLGTNYSLFKYDIARNKLSLLPHTGEDPVMAFIGENSRIVSIVRDTINSHPVLVISPYGHYLTYYDLTDKHWVSETSQKREFIKSFNLKDNLIRKLYKSNDGKIWVGTKMHGLGNWIPQETSGIKYLKNDSLNKVSINTDDVFDLTEDRRGVLWISSFGGGLKYYDPVSKKLGHVPESSNLSEGVLTDEKNNIWTVCNGHIHKYNPLSNIYSCYDLPILKKTGGLKGYLYKDDLNNFYASGINYYVSFNPEQVAKINNQPKVYLTDFKIFNRSQSELLQQKTINLDYDQNYFSIEFAAPDYSSDNIQYAYRLEGIDKSWINAERRTTAIYTHLPGGEYTFMVRAGNWKNTYGNRFTQIKIHVYAPFWERWYFYLLIMITITVIIYAILGYRVKNFLIREQMRNRIAVDLHDNVGSTLSSISIYSQVARIYQEQKETIQLEKVLKQINNASLEMIDEIGDIVWAINPKNDYLSGIINRMESYAKPLCEAKGIIFTLETDLKLTVLNLKMDVRKNLYLISKEAINNAVKYSRCKSIKMVVHQSGKRLFLSIKDDGIGFDSNDRKGATQSLSGNGLENMQLRASEIDAVFIIQSVVNQGTYIELQYIIDKYNR